MALAAPSTNRLALRARAGQAGVSARPVVLMRADVKQGREYRESDDTISSPGQAPKKANDALYADQVPRVPKKKDNLSPEMRARLKQEYVGLGGSANSIPAAAPRMPIVAATTVYEERQGTTESQEATTSAATPAPAPATAAKKGSSKWVIDENENLKSTAEHRAWTWTSIALIAATMNTAVGQVHDGGDAFVLGAAFLTAYVLADFATGVYHWGVDNYGDANTPVFGRQIAAFQGHHQRPWTITQREFCNNVHQVFQPASYFGAAFFAVSPLMPLAWNSFISSFLFMVCMSQQFHAWSHMKKSELHPAVVALQEAGLLIGRKEHGAHHMEPFEANYCIVSGLWNKTLDSSGFFRKLEKVVAEKTGVEPRCWHEMQDDWKELERPASA